MSTNTGTTNRPADKPDAGTYEALMARKGEIIRKAVGIDYSRFESGSIAFDYEGMMKSTGYSLDEVREIQSRTGVGNTPLLELRNITELARRYAPDGKGARIFLKDEAANPSGSFKARRAATSVYHARKLGFTGVATAETTVPPWQARRRCTVWTASSCRNASIPREQVSRRSSKRQENARRWERRYCS